MRIAVTLGFYVQPTLLLTQCLDLKVSAVCEQVSDAQTIAGVTSVPYTTEAQWLPACSTLLPDDPR